MTETLETRVKAHPIYFYITSMATVSVAAVGVMMWMHSNAETRGTLGSQPAVQSQVKLDPQTVLTAAKNQISHMHAFMANGQLTNPRIESAQAFRLSLYQYQLWASGFNSLDHTTLFAMFKEEANPQLFAKYKESFFGASEALNAMSLYFQDIANDKRPPKTLSQDQVDQEFLDLWNNAQERIATLTGFLNSRSASEFK